MSSTSRITELVSTSNEELLRLAFNKSDVSSLELELALRLEQIMDLYDVWEPSSGVET